jgi:uncharacterized Tic20 family protein
MSAILFIVVLGLGFGALLVAPYIISRLKKKSVGKSSLRFRVTVIVAMIAGVILISIGIFVLYLEYRSLYFQHLYVNLV